SMDAILLYVVPLCSLALLPGSTLFPYTTLFRSELVERRVRHPGLSGSRPRCRPPPRPAARRCRSRVPAGGPPPCGSAKRAARAADRKSTRLNSSHVKISYAVFCLKKKKNNDDHN